MIWKSVMKAADYEAPFFNWKHILSGINMEVFRAKYLDPARGYCGVVSCPERCNCEFLDCQGLNLVDLSTGKTARCQRKFLGPKIPVTDEDVARYALSYPRFHKAICDKLNLSFTSTQIDNFFWELGTYKIGTGKLLPVYISYYITQKQLTDKLKELLLQKPDGRFVLIVYDNTFLAPLTARILTEHNCVCVSMAELFTMNADCSLTLQTTPVQIFGRYKDDKVIAAVNTYPCPAGTTWGDIHINILDRETLSVWRRGESSMAVSYAMLGMASGKSNKPTKCFRFLVAALEDGLTAIPVPAKTTKEYRPMVQRKKEMNDKLKAFFPDIQDGDPIEFVDSENCYQFRFQSRTI
ncbi:MAG: hypothetical protein J6S98_07755 [Lentisphaeria bacterium]|nr:hypothetical protein [Lentisphaeria bacterium]